MKKYRFLTFILLNSLAIAQLFSQVSFDDYFLPKTLRFDYLQAGDADSMTVLFQQLKMEPYWGGPKINLIDTFQYGEFMLNVFDSASNKLIYSRGYSALSQEWQTTPEASITNRSFYESVIMPFPKKSITITILKRNKNCRFEKLFTTTANPTDQYINGDPVPAYKTVKYIDNGDPADHVDIVFLPEGYTTNEMAKFENDVKRFTTEFFRWSPYDRLKKAFNIWMVEAPSQDSGTDNPATGVWKNTILNSGFSTFKLDRYLTTTDYKEVRDLASCVPYDQICIIVNTDKYGGGGIYNYYNLFTSDNTNSDFLFMHEFGHSFASLADEYYESDVAYNDYYNLKCEPYEPNITTLVDFNKKWKAMVDKDTPIPTPPVEMYKAKVGVFEGGGYLAKGIYRPYFDCTMKSVSINNFCPVCRQAIIQMIYFYTGSSLKK